MPRNPYRPTKAGTPVSKRANKKRARRKNKANHGKRPGA